MSHGLIVLGVACAVVGFGVGVAVGVRITVWIIEKMLELVEP